MKKILLVLLACTASSFGIATAEDLEELWFRPLDPLAQRDDYGLLHQSKVLYPTDFERRYSWRPLYYLEGGRDLVRQPAYVGALQVSLARRGYYCGPIDGIFSDSVSEAIAHMQKNYSMHVTGTITIPVRRALHLP
jgi:Putative peptidoglycan binding domain